MSTVQSPCCPSFTDSLTCRNLRSACLGEMHTARHFRHCAQLMDDASLQVIAHAFRFTAAQDSEHAAILSGLLCSLGGSLPAAEDVPSSASDTPAELLRAAALHKHGAWDVLYPQYARAAREEGYPRIATALERMAETEQLHARRFAQYLEALGEGTLFAADTPVSWVCLHCSQLHTGCTPPESCPGCSRGQGHFIRSDFYPFSVSDF